MLSAPPIRLRKERSLESRAARFWSNIDQSGGPNACWPWRGKSGNRGYGDTAFVTKLGNLRGGHRIAFWLHYGRWPGRKCVCQTCDHPWCRNPAHLFLGTQQVNVADRDAKGRTAAVLTAIQGLKIRRLCRVVLSPGGIRRYVGVSPTALAHKLGVDRQTIYDVLNDRRKTI
jgi:hypothetical protein